MPTMPEQILFVDDDPNILSSYKRQFSRFLRIETALSGLEGLEAIRTRGPFAVVISDNRMPNMDGVTFLGAVRDMAPDTVRIMLTGYADLQTAVQAVNTGSIFRFLTKPCPLDDMAKAITGGVKQYRLVTSERELLEKTLKGSIQLLTEVLATVNPEAHVRTLRLARLAREVGQRMAFPDMWLLETAALLSQIGHIMLSERTTIRARQSGRLSQDELELFSLHPSLAANLIGHIPRLEEVARVVEYQEKCFDGSGIPVDDLRGEAIPQGARVLKVVLDYDAMAGEPPRKGVALKRLRENGHLYDPVVIEALEKYLGVEAKYDVTQVSLYELKDGMILAANVYTIRNCKLALAAGQELNPALIAYLHKYAKAVGIGEPIRVIVPLADDVDPEVIRREVMSKPPRPGE